MVVDRYGRGVHLGERDCSVQRRHQKIVEEAPTPALPPASRAELCERAIAAVVAAGYENVGTLEFLVDREGGFYFIEINCRIQVEHPGDGDADRDRHGRRPRSGSRRASRSASARRTCSSRGHAFEFRINAEDAAHDFRPQAGRVERFYAPGGPGVRFDSHLYAGYEVPPYYDSLLGKLVVWGPGSAGRRSRAPRPPSTSWSSTGITTNRAFHRAHPGERGVRRGARHHQPDRPDRDRRVPRAPRS